MINHEIILERYLLTTKTIDETKRVLSVFHDSKLRIQTLDGKVIEQFKNAGLTGIWRRKRHENNC